MIEGFALVHENYPEARLKLVGDGPMRKELEVLVAEKGLASKIEFLGFLRGNSLRAIYIASDIFVLPTIGHEGWGVVVQEALAAGLPIIASWRVGAARDFLTQQEVGRLFCPGCAEDLSENLSELISLRHHWSKISLEAKKLVAATSSKTAAKRIVEFLESSGQSSI